MKMKLRDLGEIITGNTPSKKTIEFWDSEDICFVKPDTISDTDITDITDTNEYISEFARSKARVVGENAIFVTCIGSIGKIGIAKKGEYAFNQQINAIIPNSKINSKYLAYAILAAKPKLIAIANAPVVPIINKSQFGDFEIEISENMNEQKNIVEVLDTTKAIIEARQQELQKLDELIKARFVELFGDIKTNNMGWDKVQLKNIADVRGRVGWKGYKKEDLREAGPLVLGATHLTDNGGIDLSAPVYLSREKYEESPEIVLEKGDLIFTQRGNTIGKVGLIEKEIGEATINPCVLILRPISIHPIFFKSYFVMDATKDDMWLLNSGSAQPMITQKGIGEYMMMLPPMELQEQFADFVKQVDKSKVAVQRALDEAQLLFDSLMQKYFG